MTTENESAESIPAKSRKYSTKEYVVRYLDEEGGVHEKKVRLDITPQVRPADSSAVVPMPDQSEINAKISQEKLEHFTESLRLVVADDKGVSPQTMGTILLALAKKPQTPAVSTEVVAQPTSTLTKKQAQEKLLGYLGSSYSVVDDEIFDGVDVVTLADNLGTLVSNLDGTEEFAFRILESAKHPRFYFRGDALRRAKQYITRAAGLLNDFPWRYADNEPAEAITDLRVVGALVQNAIAALTGRGAERPVVPGAFNEDGSLEEQKDKTLRKLSPGISIDVGTFQGRELSQKALDVLESQPPSSA